MENSCIFKEIGFWRNTGVCKNFPVRTWEMKREMVSLFSQALKVQGSFAYYGKGR